MTDAEGLAAELAGLLGQQVVVDTKGPFVYLGVLDAVCRDSLRLAEADVHDTRDSNTSVDLYLIDARKHGVRANRHVAYVLLKEVVRVSPLSEVVLY